MKKTIKTVKKKKAKKRGRKPISNKRSLMDFDAEYRRRRRLQERDIGIIPPPKNPKRVKKLRNDRPGFLKTYIPETFYLPFTKDQLDYIEIIYEVMVNGGLRAEAAARGDGKTSIAEGMLVYAICYGILRFPVLIGASGPIAKRSLDYLRELFQTPSELTADFPLICYPIVCLDRSPQKAARQTYMGKSTRMKWKEDEIVFPTIPGSVASGSVIGCRGIEGKIRGWKYQSLRPDFVLLDDLDNRESAKSELQTKDKINIIESDIAGLRGRQRKFGIVNLCTIISKGCVADYYTDRQKKTAWRGNRRKMIYDWPVDETFMQKYIELRQTDQLMLDSDYKESREYYCKNQIKIEKGIKISNPYNYEPERHLSTFHFCCDYIADHGREMFNNEYQNEPPDPHEDSDKIELPHIQKKLSGRGKGIVPAWCQYLTCGIDLGKFVFHWVTGAWRQGLIGEIIDYGTEPVYSPTGNPDETEQITAIEEAILNALMNWYDQYKEGWPDDTGKMIPLKLAFIDSGWMPDPVYEFCKRIANRIFWPSKGFGTARGQSRYLEPRSDKKNIRPGHHFFLSRVGTRVLVNLDDDYWKRFIHQGFLTDFESNGSISLFGNNPMIHRAFAEQIVAEQWISEFVTGKGLVEYWDKRYKHNHYLDGSKQSAAAAAMAGIRLIQTLEKKEGKSETKSQKKEIIRENRREKSSFIQRSLKQQGQGWFKK